MPIAPPLKEVEFNETSPDLTQRSPQVFCPCKKTTQARKGWSVFFIKLSVPGFLILCPNFIRWLDGIPTTAFLSGWQQNKKKHPAVIAECFPHLFTIHYTTVKGDIQGMLVVFSKLFSHFSVVSRSTSDILKSLVSLPQGKYSIIIPWRRGAFIWNQNKNVRPMTRKTPSYRPLWDSSNCTNHGLFICAILHLVIYLTMGYN